MHQGSRKGFDTMPRHQALVLSRGTRTLTSWPTNVHIRTLVTLRSQCGGWARTTLRLPTGSHGSESLAGLGGLRRGGAPRPLRPSGTPATSIQKACRTLKPPMNMRFPSIGMVPAMSLNDGSSIIAFIARSRSSRDLYTAHDNITISSSPSCTAWGNDVCLPGFTSSAMQSTYSRAPCFLTKSLMFFVKALYSPTLDLGTGTT